MEGITLQPAPESKTPLCPYCKKALEIVWVKKDGLGIWGQSEVLMCPHCESFLGYSAWKR